MISFRNLILTIVLTTLSLQAEEIYATFTVEAQKSANLAFTATGIVKKVNVDVGDLVEKDMILVELDNSDAKALLDVAKANLKTAQVSQKYARKKYKRYKSVRSTINATTFDKIAQNKDTSSATVAQQKANIIYRKAQLDKTQLRAPFDGVVYEKLVEEGDTVSGAMIRTVLKVQSVHDVKLVLEFDERYWNSVKVGNIFEYKLTGDDKAHRGKISKIYPSIDMSTHKIKAEVQAVDIKVGLFGDGNIILGE